MLDAVEAPAGETTVVLGPGWNAVLLHEAVGHHVDGGLEIEVLPFGRPRRAVEHLELPPRRIDQLLAGRTLGAQSASRDRRVRVTLDLDDPLILDVHPLTAADRAVRADALHDPVGSGRASGDGSSVLGGHCRTTAERVTRTQLTDDWPFKENLRHSHAQRLVRYPHRRDGLSRTTDEDRRVWGPRITGVRMRGPTPTPDDVRQGRRSVRQEALFLIEALFLKGCRASPDRWAAATGRRRQRFPARRPPSALPPWPAAARPGHASLQRALCPPRDGRAPSSAFRSPW